MECPGNQAAGKLLGRLPTNGFSTSLLPQALLAVISSTCTALKIPLALSWVRSQAVYGSALVTSKSLPYACSDPFLEVREPVVPQHAAQLMCQKSLVPCLRRSPPRTDSETRLVRQGPWALSAEPSGRPLRCMRLPPHQL